MNNRLGLQRRKTVILCALVAIFAGLGGVLQKTRPHWVPLWMGILAGLLFVAIFQFIKLKQEEGR